MSTYSATLGSDGRSMIVLGSSGSGARISLRGDEVTNFSVGGNTATVTYLTRAGNTITEVYELPSGKVLDRIQQRMTRRDKPSTPPEPRPMPRARPARATYRTDGDGKGGGGGLFLVVLVMVLLIKGCGGGQSTDNVTVYWRTHNQDGSYIGEAK